MELDDGVVVLGTWRVKRGFKNMRICKIALIVGAKCWREEQNCFFLRHDKQGCQLTLRWERGCEVLRRRM